MPGFKEMEWQLRLLQQRYATLARAKASFDMYRAISDDARVDVLKAEAELNHARKEFETATAGLDVDALLEIIEGKIHAGA